MRAPLRPGRGLMAGPLSNSKLEEHRRRLQELVARDGLDAHQFEAHELVWSYAKCEAEAAIAKWARRCGDRRAALSWEIAADDAAGLPERGELLAERGRDPLGSEELGVQDDHRLLRRSIREFAERVIKPRAQEIHRFNLDVPEAIVEGAAGMGLFGLSIPERYGGSLGEQPDTTTMMVVTEELSRASLGAGGSLITRPEILVRALLRGGTEDQRGRWLPEIASGRKLVAVAVTEPDAGSDVASIRCRATRRPDGSWIVRGTKLWSTWAGRAELLMLLCRTGAPGHLGLSLFVAEKPAFAGHSFEHVQPDGGVLRGRAIPTIGYRGMHTFELQFEDFVLPADALVGGEEWLDRGFYLQMEGFTAGRLQTAARAVGMMQAALEDATGYARERVVFGQPLASFQLPQAMLGRMAARLDASRQLSYCAASQLDTGEGRMQASLAKLYACRMAEAVTRDAVQLFGGMGYAEETAVSRYFVDARVLSIFEGTEEVLALRVIARSLLEPAAPGVGGQRA